MNMQQHMYLLLTLLLVYGTSRSEETQLLPDSQFEWKDCSEYPQTYQCNTLIMT